MRFRHIPLIGQRLLVMAACVLAALGTAFAQGDGERIAGFRQRTFAITGATVVPKPGETIPKGTIVVRDGLIVAVGADVSVPPEAEIIDATGLFVYPGFIDAAAADLLDKDKAPKPEAGRPVDFTRYVLAATRPDNRKSLTPEFRAADALKRDADALEAARKSGFTTLHVLPDGRIAAGQGALLTTGAGPLREVLLDQATFAEFELFPPGGEDYPATLMGCMAHLRQALLDAEHCRKHCELYETQAPGVTRPPVDDTLTALQTVLAGEVRPVFQTNSRDAIHRALDFCEEHELSPVLWGGHEAHKTVDRLKAENVSVIMQLDFGTPPKIEPQPDSEKLTADIKDPLRVQRDRLARWKAQVAGPKTLHAHGVRFAFSTRGLKKREEVFTSLRQAIEQGLPRDAALAALTIDAAALLGVEERLGTLAEGKLGHVVVMTGPFDHEKSKVRFMLIDGTNYEYNTDAKPVNPDQDETAGPNIAGEWNLEIDSADGKVHATLKLEQDGTKLTGLFRSTLGDGKLTEGAATAETIEFTVAIGAGASSLPLRFTAKLEDDKLAGTLKPAFGAETKWTAERQTSDDDDEKNPVKLAVAEEKAEAPAPPDALPSELESDRLNQQVDTGGNVLIKNATVITGSGQTLAETSILVRDGKIAVIGPDLEPDEGMHVIEARGLFVMPGIIDTHSHIMISGGTNESTQSIVPEVRIRDVVSTDQASEYRALTGGVTTARLLHGSANVIGGQDAVVKLKYGRTAKEHILHDAPQGVKFALGENVKYHTERFPNTRLGVEATLNRAFLEAVDYRRQWQEYEQQVKENGEDGLLPPRRDLRLEALADIVSHEKFIHSHCYRADEILMLLRVASNLGIRVWSLQHVLEGYKIAPEIAEHGASCSTFSDWWAYKVEAFDAIPHNAALLHEAGINVCIKSDDSELIRHLYHEAAKTVRYGGMPPDAAIQTITLNPARELGLDDRIGSIEIGKDGDLAIFNGHPLSAFARCEMTLIEGDIYFSRKNAPTAMTDAMKQRSARAPELSFPSQQARSKTLDLDEAAGGKYAIVGAMLHVVDGPAIENGVVIIENGKITQVGIGEAIAVPSDAKVIDADGLHVAPGFIDAGTTLGLTEIGKVRETQDYSEGGLFQPDLRAGIALNRDSELIPAARAGGITTILIRPTGGVIAGQSSLARLEGWTTEEMVLDYETGLQINWPGGKDKEKRLEQLRELFA
ncbi:MAG: amidohydrolase family protein, partial [Planctomycetaceae bacterium]